MSNNNDNGDGARPPFTDLAELQPKDGLEAAVLYKRWGLRVTPVNGKAPCLPGWPTKDLAEEELPEHFTADRNVGIGLGEPSGGLVDIDLDVFEAVKVADHLLPKTLMFGRENSPYSHRLYLCDPTPKSKTYSLPKDMAYRLGLEPKGATLVELRSNGRQSVFPPSIHPDDGDRYIFYPGTEAHQISGKELEELVRDVAIATLLALYWPDGSRQFFVLHTAGYLGRHMAHNRVVAILKAAAVVASLHLWHGGRSRKDAS